MSPRQLIFAFTVLGTLAARQDTAAIMTPTESGFLLVECDSTGLDIYVDDMLVGPAPIRTPIPLPPGRHTVTYLHPELIELLRSHYPADEIAGLMTKSMKTVYLIPGETVTVQLWWNPYKQELKERKRRFWMKSMVGVALLAVVLGLNLL
ncbi:MAG: hypothetical protein ACE5HZ_06030 [Fidelibacterota bacterium]